MKDDSERKAVLEELTNMRRLVVTLMDALGFSETHSQFLDRLDSLITRLEEEFDERQ